MIPHYLGLIPCMKADLFHRNISKETLNYSVSKSLNKACTGTKEVEILTKVIDKKYVSLFLIAISYPPKYKSCLN